MAARDTVVPVLIGLAVCGAIVTAGLVIQRNRASTQVAPAPADAQSNSQSTAPAPPGDKNAPTPVRDWEQYISTGRLIGPQNAALTLVEFADFQCPACKVLHDRLKQLRSEYPRDFAISYHYVPLPYHEMAYPAARAAECAAEQGRFEEYHDKLFEHTESLAKVSLRTLAVEAGVPDIKKFSTCASRTEPVERIERDRDQAMGTLQIRGTPTVLLNGQMYSYTPSNAAIKVMIEEARSQKGQR